MSDVKIPPLEPRFVDALGVRTAFYVAGNENGRPVILLHGMTASADNYREIMYHFADEHWLIAPDIPGFGESDDTEPYTVPHLVEWLAAFHDALELPSAIVLGHSFGGALATAYAVTYPEDVHGLFLIAPAVLVSNYVPDSLKRMGIGFGLLDLGMALSQTDVVNQRQMGRAVFDTAVYDGDGIMERRKRNVQLSRASGDVLKALAFHDDSDKLGSVIVPVCLVWGEHDPVVLPSDGQKLVELFPNAELHLLPECGHVPMLEKPAELWLLLKKFLGSI